MVSGGSGTPLAVLAYAGTVAHASLAGMTELPDIRELADIPAVEVITRSAVMLMSADLRTRPQGHQRRHRTCRRAIHRQRRDPLRHAVRLGCTRSARHRPGRRRAAGFAAGSSRRGARKRVGTTPPTNSAATSPH